MCGGCWAQYTPAHPFTPAMAEAVNAVRALYEVHSTGGAMHIVVDDWNISDDEVSWCEAGLSDEVERRCFAALTALTERERATALAVHDGFYVPVED